MTATTASGNRYEWIDWMKALGIYLVVLGHFYSVCEKFIYVFHIPLFLLISGLLTKKESDGRIFWKKLWYNLVVPMLIIATLNFAFHGFQQLLNGYFHPSDVYWFVRNVLFGMVSGFDTLWFVYTLILLKILFQYCFSEKLFYSLTIVMLALAYVYNHYDLSDCPFFLKEPNSIVNILTAFPFFAFGVFVGDFKEKLNEWNNKMMLVIAFVCSSLLLFVCCHFNDYVAMFCCYYGENMLLFLVGGFAGSLMVFGVSKLFGYAPKPIAITSKGTIIILGFHKILINMVRTFFYPSVLDAVFAILIVLLFIPFIIIIAKFFPLMLGKYRLKNNND